jgi:predicted nucleotidyltransferase
VKRARFGVVDGKAIYDGRPLAAWVPEVVARVFERTGATRVVVFGGVARGDDGPDSDIDLVVVLPTVTRRHDDAVRVMRALRDLPPPVDVLVVDQAGLERQSQLPGVIRVAMREGWLIQRER